MFFYCYALLIGSQCRYLAALNDPTSTKKLNWTKLEKRHDHDFNHNIADPNSLNYFIPGGGIAQKFFKMRLVLFYLFKLTRTVSST